MGMQDIALAAKHLARAQHSGVLGTHSTSMPGYPFGSVVPYYLTHEGDAVIYISDIALHTRNIKANDKVSLTIFDNEEDDSQANGRVTIMGNATCIKDANIETQYLRLFPQAKGYKRTHDFNFYVIKTERVRYIGGFGKIHWIDKAYWQQQKQDWHSNIEGMITHMNEDHLDAMSLILKHKLDIDVLAPTMCSVFPEGAHYTYGENVWFVPFEEVCRSAKHVREQLVIQTKQAREALSPAIEN
jgi:putative heme iron utilization protein